MPKKMSLLKDISLPALRAGLLWKLFNSSEKTKRIEILSLLGLLSTYSIVTSGPRHSLMNSFFGTTTLFEKCAVEGYCAPGFEGVKEAFEKNVKNGLELGAQYVVYFKGEKVVDLYGGTLDNYHGDSLQVCFSCSKFMASVICAILVDRGQLSYDATVRSYWPEFAKHGKGSITVADVLRHEGGLPYFEKKMSMKQIKNLDELASWIANQKPVWVHNDNVTEGDRIYHGNTRGFILNELSRRVDPQHRSIGQIYRQDIVPMLNNATIVLGDLTDEERSRVHPLAFEKPVHTVARAVREGVSLQSTEDDFKRAIKISNPASHLFRWFNAWKIDLDIADELREEFFNSNEFHDLEVPSVNMISNARSLAQVANLLSQGKLLKPDTLAFSDPTEKYDRGMCIKTKFTKGGFNHFVGEEWADHLHDGDQGFMGWGGFGGSMVAFDKKDTAISYTMNGPLLASIFGFRDPRCLSLMKATMNAINKVRSSKL